MKFLIDADMPKSSADVVKSLGYETVDARDIGLGTAKDEQIFDYALKNGFSIITRDLDFANILVYVPTTTSAILILRPAKLKIIQVNNILAGFFRNIKASDIAGATVIISPHRYRIRKHY